MTIREILNTTEHRPWEMPTENWKFYQEWNNTIFLHWQVELSEMEKFVPKELKIDLFDGKPWISVVAFTMEKIRPKNLPSFPPISNFDEINIRTYVKSNNKTGVYFLSIEGGKSLSCKVAKYMSELPYRFSEIKRTENQYQSNNSKFNDKLNIQFTTGKGITEKTELDKWLTEKYALFQDTGKSINEFEIHHLEWPINEIDLGNLEFNYPRFDKLIISFKCDIFKQEELDKLTLFIEQGHKDLNILINNAGIQYNYNFTKEHQLLYKVAHKINVN